MALTTPQKSDLFVMTGEQLMEKILRDRAELNARIDAIHDAAVQKEVALAERLGSQLTEVGEGRV